MMILNNKQYNTAVEGFNQGQIGVIPTDTLYGISCQALNRDAVEKIYTIKERNQNKPFIIIISNIEEVQKLGVKLEKKHIEYANTVWPGPVSILMPITEPGFDYLHRGTNNLAFRVPNKTNLLNLLKKTGPLVSTTANISQQDPAKNIETAIKYFGDKIDFYIDEGQLDNAPSKLVKLEGDTLQILR